MKTLKEEREAIVEAIKDYDENVGWVCYPDDVATALLSHEEKVRDERDTYWKERVRKDLDRRLEIQKKVLHSEYEGGYTQALQDIKEALDTLLDNLK